MLGFGAQTKATPRLGDWEAGGWGWGLRSQLNRITKGTFVKTAQVQEYEASRKKKLKIGVFLKEKQFYLKTKSDEKETISLKIN